VRQLQLPARPALDHGGQRPCRPGTGARVAAAVRTAAAASIPRNEWLPNKAGR